jgi:hypothetical protein
MAEAQRGPKNHQYRADLDPERRKRMDRTAFLRALPPEERTVLVEQSIHRPRTDAEKVQHSQTMKEWYATHVHPFTGRQHSEETRLRLAEATRAHIAAHGNPRSLPVTYEGVTYPSIKAAMDATGRDRRVFRRLLRNGRARYLDEVVDDH